MDYKYLNSQNLYSFYRRTSASSNDISLKKNGRYEFVINVESVWPNCIFNISAHETEENFIAELNQDIKLYNRKPIVITDDNSRVNIILRKNGYLPVDFWVGMYIIPIETRKEKILPLGEIGFVNTKEDLTEWLELVSDELFSGSSLSVDIFNYLLILDCKLLYIRQDGKLIATAMIYHDEYDIDGIYMVCVSRNYRGKGYGKLIMNNILQFLYERKSRLCILQSTRLGISMYKSTGFINSNRYNLFMKIK